MIGSYGEEGKLVAQIERGLWEASRAPEPAKPLVFTFTSLLRYKGGGLEEGEHD